MVWLLKGVIVRKWWAHVSNVRKVVGGLVIKRASSKLKYGGFCQ